MGVTAESELLAKCLQGDPDAWDRLFDLHYGAAARFVTQMSPGFSAEDVEEICQETFLTVIRNLASFKGQSQFQTWLFRVAANKAKDFLEKQRAQKRGGGEAPLSLDAEDRETGLKIDPPSAGAGPDEVLARREKWSALHAALEEVGEPCRETIELRYFGDLSYEEIAAALEMNAKTVSSRLSKCLDKLEELLQRGSRREGSASISV